MTTRTRTTTRRAIKRAIAKAATKETIKPRPYTHRDTLYWARKRLSTLGLTIPGLLAKHATL